MLSGELSDESTKRSIKPDPHEFISLIFSPKSYISKYNHNGD